jgi:hypothetical protein
MAQPASKFQPEYVVNRREPTSLGGCAQAGGSVLLTVAGIVAMGMLAMAPPSFAQRGGGGGSHGGGGMGGHFGGGGEAHSAGSRSHSSSGKGGHATGSSSGARATKRGPAVYGVDGVYMESRTTKPRQTGIGAAFRRLFGLSHSSTSPTDTLVESSAISSTSALVSRAAARASLPPAFSHLVLNQSPSVALGGSAPVRLGRAALPSPRPAVSAPPRPIGPPPRRFYPIGIGFYGGYAPTFGLGFGFPFFGFDCFWFDCFGFNYLGSYSAPWHYNAQPQATMLLYLTDGSAFEVTDYWVEGDSLHYIAEEGGEDEVRVSDVDVERTTDANARVGFRFTLDRTRRGTPLDRVKPPTNPPEEPQSPQK